MHIDLTFETDNCDFAKECIVSFLKKFDYVSGIHSICDCYSHCHRITIPKERQFEFSETITNKYLSVYDNNKDKTYYIGIYHTIVFN